MQHVTPNILLGNHSLLLTAIHGISVKKWEHVHLCTLSSWTKQYQFIIHRVDTEQH